GLHLAEGLRAALGQEHGIVAEAARAPGRPHQRAVDAAFMDRASPVRHGEAERAGEMRLTLFRGRRAAGGELLLDIAHGEREVARGTGPARRIDAGLAAER